MVFARQRKTKTIWYARFQDQTGAWVSEKSGTDEQEAIRLQKRREREVLAGAYVPKSACASMTFEAWAKDWLSRRKNKDKAHDESHLRIRVIPVIGHIRFDDLRNSHCVQLSESILAACKSSATAANTWGTFLTCMRDARLRELTNLVPTLRKGAMSKKTKPITELYSTEDVAKLTGNFKPTTSMDMLSMLGFYTGMRRGEICGLRWSDWTRADEFGGLGSLLVTRQFDGIGPHATIKTEKPRIVPVHPLLASVLEAWAWQLGSSGIDDSPIVPNRPGEHYSGHVSYNHFESHCKARGVKHLGAHRMRHTAITAMRRGGASKTDVELVTHNAAGEMVDRYTHEWALPCRAVCCLDYSCRVVRRVATPEVPQLPANGRGTLPLGAQFAPRSPPNGRQRLTL